MNNQPPSDRAFDILSQEARIIRTARMLDEKTRLERNQRVDIADRFRRFIGEHGHTQAQVAREIGVSSTTISEVVRLKYTGKTADAQLCKLHNWMELAARRENIVGHRAWVETSVARDILQVASLVAETCKMGVVFGPAQIGKTLTLEAIEGDQRFGDPVLVRIDESLLLPMPVCRAIADRFELPTAGPFDALFRRIVKRLRGTKRMIVFDEIERANYRTLETIRDLHDETGCPILLSGKPAIYERLGFRAMGDYSEVCDQLAARIVIRRDLTERTRGDHPQPLFSKDDVRKLIDQAGLKLNVTPEAIRWLQNRASTLGMGGVGKALVCIYLAYKMAFVQGLERIDVEHLEAVENLSMGHEDAKHVADVVAETATMRRVV